MAELTTRTLTASLLVTGEPPRRLLVCGGGARNADLMQRLSAAMPHTTVETTAACGIDPQHVEATGFAWLAHRYVSALAGNFAVRHRRESIPVALGALYRGAVV